jgi:hypothetical protein
VTIPLFLLLHPLIFFDIFPLPMSSLVIQENRLFGLNLIVGDRVSFRACRLCFSITNRLVFLLC